MVCNWSTSGDSHRCIVPSIRVFTGQNGLVYRRRTDNLRSVCDKLSWHSCERQSTVGCRGLNPCSPLSHSDCVNSASPIGQLRSFLSQWAFPSGCVCRIDLLVIPGLRERVQCGSGVQESQARLSKKYNDQRHSDQQPL